MEFMEAACCSRACHWSTTDVLVEFRDPSAVSVRHGRFGSKVGSIPAGKEPAATQVIAAEEAPVWIGGARTDNVRSV